MAFGTHCQVRPPRFAGKLYSFDSICTVRNAADVVSTLERLSGRSEGVGALPARTTCKWLSCSQRPFAEALLLCVVSWVITLTTVLQKRSSIMFSVKWEDSSSITSTSLVRNPSVSAYYTSDSWKPSFPVPSDRKSERLVLENSDAWTTANEVHQLLVAPDHDALASYVTVRETERAQRERVFALRAAL